MVALSVSSGVVSAVSRSVPPNARHEAEKAPVMRLPQALSGAIMRGFRRPSAHARCASCSASSSGARLILSICHAESV